MAGIGRGTTPTNTFSVDVDLRDAEVVYLTYKQGSKITLEKEKGDLEIDEDEVRVYLTQEETLALKFGGNTPVRMQFRARYADGNAIKSNIMQATVEEILKDGVI